MTSTTKRAKCLSGSHSSTDGGRRYPVARSIVRKLLTSAHPETKKGRINVSILPDAAQCAKSDRLLGGAPDKIRTCDLCLRRAGDISIFSTRQSQCSAAPLGPLLRPPETVATVADDTTCRPFMNQIATVPALV